MEMSEHFKILIKKVRRRRLNLRQRLKRIKKILKTWNVSGDESNGGNCEQERG